MAVSSLTARKTLSLSSNQLKILGAVSMVIDHVGYLFFPDMAIFRILGRLALPIFAFMIAQGCRHTRNKLRYFSGVFLLAAACQLVYWFAMGSTFMCILVTFSVAILLVYALQYSKRTPGLARLVFPAAVAAAWWLNQVLTIDYGFWGCLLPVFACLFQDAPKALDRLPVHVAALGVGLLILAADRGGVQIWALVTLPLLLLYSGRRGTLPMKYFFYIFYPAHLVVLQGLYLLLRG